MIRAAAFDFDGTLVDSNPIKQRAYFEAAAEVDPDGKAVAAVLARRPAGDRHAVMRLVADELSLRGATPDGLSAEELARSLAAAYTRLCEEGVSRCREVPGATRALRELAARGLALFINTATPRDAVLTILRRRGLLDLFAGVYGAETGKLEGLRRIAGEAGARPAELVFVGDRDEDLEAARALGCRFVGVVHDGTDGFRQPPAHCVSDLALLPELVDRLGAESA
jgi:phosphoglycolate phosphatase